MPSLTRNIPKDSNLHKRLVKMLSGRIQFARAEQQKQHEKWSKAEDAILAYIPETELDAKRRTKRENDGIPKFTTIMIPYTYAILMSAHTYWTSVFFARSPVHQFAGRHGETEQQVQALEALVAYQVQVGQMLPSCYLWLYDAGKYGVGIIEDYWENETIQYASIQEEVDELGQKLKQIIRVKAPGYRGNKACNISPFDFFPDPRVPVGRFQEGEFCFVRKRLSWDSIIKRKAQGYYMNTDRLKGRGGTQEDASSSQLDRPENVYFDDEGDVKHPAVVPVYEFHVSIIPKEWGLDESDFPEKWVFTITTDLSTIIGAQPHGAMHGQFPFAVLEPEVEAYGTWNRGIPETIEGVQQTLDWLLNTHFFNVRASMNNQFILDPSKLVLRDAEEAGPGFIWRLRPEAYGQDIRSFFYQVPVQDMTRGHVADMSVMFALGERITGVNDQIMGVLASGGRKTATEVRTSTGFGVNRLKTTTEYMSATGFSQHVQRLVQNSQQFYAAPQKMRIVGSLALDAGPQFLEVTPDAIQGFYDFVPVDGTMPVDRLAQAHMWKELLVQMRNVPGLLMTYDLSRIFAHVATLAGVRNVQQFRIQPQSSEALAQLASAGNVVPITGGRGGGSRSAGVPAGSPVMPPNLPSPPPMEDYLA